MNYSTLPKIDTVRHLIRRTHPRAYRAQAMARNHFRITMWCLLLNEPARVRVRMSRLAPRAADSSCRRHFERVCIKERCSPTNTPAGLAGGNDSQSVFRCTAGRPESNSSGETTCARLPSRMILAAAKPGCMRDRAAPAIPRMPKPRSQS